MRCDALQLENNVDFREFLEVHKSKSRKSAWANDIVLPASEERRRQKVKTSDKSHSSDVDDEAATENAGTREVKEKKKLSDLEASGADSLLGVVLKTHQNTKQLKEPNKFHVYETEKITRKASDAAEDIELFGSFTRDRHARRI